MGRSVSELEWGSVCWDMRWKVSRRGQLAVRMAPDLVKTAKWLNEPWRSRISNGEL